jgi:hypothetical protein
MAETLAKIVPPPVRIPIDRLLVQVDGEVMANVKTVTVGVNGKGIVELAGGHEKFGHIELALPFDIVLAHIANLGGEHA